MPISVSVAEIVADLGGMYHNSPDTDIVYGQEITDAMITAQINSAITFVNMVAGTSRVNTFLASPDSYQRDVPKQAVIKIAGHKVLNRMMGNIMTADYSVTIDGLSLNKSNFPQILQNAIVNIYNEAVQYLEMLKSVVWTVDQKQTSMQKSGIELMKDAAGAYGYAAPDPYE